MTDRVVHCDLCGLEVTKIFAFYLYNREGQKEKYRGHKICMESLQKTKIEEWNLSKGNRYIF